jgi:hypothetical protein
LISGLFNSISDIYYKLESIKGSGEYDSLPDVWNKLDEISTTLNSIDLNTTGL